MYFINWNKMSWNIQWSGKETDIHKAYYKVKAYCKM
jgi:hypothetical protein